MSEPTKALIDLYPLVLKIRYELQLEAAALLDDGLADMLRQVETYQE